MAISSHRQWVRGLMRTIACHTMHTKMDLCKDAHLLCASGEWYYGEQPAELRESQFFRDIENLHRLLHESAAAMLRSEIDGKAISKDQFDSFYYNLDEFVEVLENLKKEINTLLYNRDPLTGAYNRRSLNDELCKIKQLISSEVNNACIIIFDLDHFKSINDRYGHRAGDQVLKQTIEVVNRNMRNLDKVLRYGGEEFVISLIQTTLKDAYKVAERMRSDIEAMEILVAETTIKATASFGIAEIISSANIFNAIEKADQALYQAKRNGRNQVLISND
ncbi:diguanylate cyclase [Vibrio sp. YYF0003]|uniref:diguanylate cyclase n=1 Tax=Vibrio sp. YYF0003 TaxID=3116646 RepID=UPI002EC4DDE2|nr:diguanylate cyclase [Vibrio sp. YYF0003]